MVAINFSIEHNPNPILAQIVGAPNNDNAIRAMIEAASARRLFTAFSDAPPITIALSYADGTAEGLLIRGWRVLRKFGGGKNSRFNECLRGLTPAPRTPSRVP